MPIPKQITESFWEAVTNVVLFLITLGAAIGLNLFVSWADSAHRLPQWMLLILTLVSYLFFVLDVIKLVVFSVKVARKELFS
jgi:hypothetical protein